MLPKLIEVAARPDFHIYLRYADGTDGVLDLNYLRGRGVFKAWDEAVAFSQVYLDAQSGAVAWSEDLDLSPHNLYEKLCAQRSTDLSLEAAA